MGAVAAAKSLRSRGMEPPSAVRERLQAFAGEVLAEAMNRPVQVFNGGVYLRGLLEQGPRKSLEPMVERLGDGADYQSLQQFLADSPWDPELVVRAVAERVVLRAQGVGRAEPHRLQRLIQMATQRLRLPQTDEPAERALAVGRGGVEEHARHDLAVASRWPGVDALSDAGAAAVGNEVLLGGTHFPSTTGGLKETDQFSVAKEVMEELAELDEQRTRRNIVLVGDFNMHPYDPGMTSVTGVHGQMTRALAEQPDRVHRGVKRRRFYNPMWGLFRLR